MQYVYILYAWLNLTQLFINLLLFVSIALFIKPLLFIIKNITGEIILYANNKKNKNIPLFFIIDTHCLLIQYK